ncbi:unnamed protein product [Adineta steineri]|uniref:ADP ribosyltransferase domain-containing protein n=1 Tax=Adineta steineri TaxID=433720 RepID=A0A815C493_9BILA|nr:unnamed protein product [Adineta steineri]CAF3891633.1 unnamed protein product [Adineta steineri]
MAAASSSSDVSHSKSDEMHLEIFCLLWLDASSSTKEGRDTEPKLRSIINHLKKFHDTAQCQKYIHERSTKERVVMIVSGRFGREIVPSIHHLRQVISIYVYCMDKAGNEKWTRNYKKIKAVVTDLDELVSRIKADHKIQKMVEEPLSINIFTKGGGAGSSTTGLNGEFVFSQILIDFLIQLQYTENDKKELIDLCKKQYKGNNDELNNIREFRERYSSNEVLWWYTRESFFYKTLNAALRTPADIHIIFLFRKYIADIQYQLKRHQAKKRLRVYRCQMISNNELETLKQNCGKFISINSFLSTSFNEQQALAFLNDSDGTENLEAILFQIDADPKMAITKPFADITEFSEFKGEAEVLFMLGSIFRLDSVKHRKSDKVWIIEMTLCNDEEHDLKQVLIDMKEQFMSEGINLQTLAKILWGMSQIDLARKYFMRLLEQLPINDPFRIDLYQDLGKIEAHAGHLDNSIEWRRKANELKKKLQSTSSSSVSKPKNPFKQPPLNDPSPTDLYQDLGKLEAHAGYLDNSTERHRKATEIKNQRQSTSSSSISKPKNPFKSKFNKWKPNAITVAGGNEQGQKLNQLNRPHGIFIHEKKNVFIAECGNDRIVEWKYNAKEGQIIAGESGQGNRMNQLNRPTDVIVDQQNHSIIVADYVNNRVIRWMNQNQQILINNIACSRLAMDKNGFLYVSDSSKNEVRRWKMGEYNNEGIVVAGGNEQGNKLNQLNRPTFIFVDKDRFIYVPDFNNHRVMKWKKGAKEGTTVAGGNGKGANLNQLHYPQGVVVNDLGQIYVADSGNDRVMRWYEGVEEGEVVVGGNGQGYQLNQLFLPKGLSFDNEEHLYVADYLNHRIQKFEIILSMKF